MSKDKLFTEEEKAESWKKGINPGQGNTESYAEASQKLLKALDLNFTKEKIVHLRKKSNRDISKNKKDI